MGLLEKIENFINRILLLLGERIAQFISKITPLKLKQIIASIQFIFSKISIYIKNIPSLIKQKIPLILAFLKKKAIALDIKGKIEKTHQLALEKYKTAKGQSKVSAFKKIFLAPFLIIGEWLNGLTTAQSVLLLTFSVSSILGAINVIFSGHRLLESRHGGARAPASVELEVSYDRPEYYKKQNRHVTITNVRLPVYYANLNEVKSIDIDFTATLSNRMSRMQVDKLELQFRDHLVLNLEPMVATFPLEEEGKEILRQKLLSEMNEFMKSREIEGEVLDIKIVYVLAN
jgi:hypothetical protein